MGELSRKKKRQENIFIYLAGFMILGSTEVGSIVATTDFTIKRGSSF